MKQTPQLDMAQARMRPGVIVRDGFLGVETRRLVDLLEDDDAAVKRLRVTHAAIAARMRALRAAGAAGLGDIVTVAPHFEVRVDSERGKLRCPFADGLAAKTTIEVVNRALERAIIFTDMGIHLIEAHGFYNGRGSPYRLEPEALVETLEVQPSW
ncbi:MAG: hypothetical protein PHR35_09865 [Kiritimatiellae bacterium]|nr:hypothetical protein [Kiritimatiellia bacterium]